MTDTKGRGDRHTDWLTDWLTGKGINVPETRYHKEPTSGQVSLPKISWTSTNSTAIQVQVLKEGVFYNQTITFDSWLQKSYFHPVIKMNLVDLQVYQ